MLVGRARRSWCGEGVKASLFRRRSGPRRCIVVVVVVEDLVFPVIRIIRLEFRELDVFKRVDHFLCGLLLLLLLLRGGCGVGSFDG